MVHRTKEKKGQLFAEHLEDTFAPNDGKDIEKEVNNIAYKKTQKLQ